MILQREPESGRTEGIRAVREQFSFRRAHPEDIEPVARLFRMTRRACLAYLPEIHTPEEDLWFFRERVFRDTDVWVAERADIAGFISYRPGWVDHLYVDPDFHGRGAGSALLFKAMEAHSHLQLWVFQKNASAISFYTARGFRLMEQTDGRRNEEHEPDALYGWERRP